MQSMTLEQLRATANAGSVTGVAFWDPEQPRRTLSKC